MYFACALLISIVILIVWKRKAIKERRMRRKEEQERNRRLKQALDYLANDDVKSAMYELEQTPCHMGASNDNCYRQGRFYKIMYLIATKQGTALSQGHNDAVDRNITILIEQTLLKMTEEEEGASDKLEIAYARAVKECTAKYEAMTKMDSRDEVVLADMINKEWTRLFSDSVKESNVRNYEMRRLEQILRSKTWLKNPAILPKV